jgi:hypothetical protein
MDKEKETVRLAGATLQGPCHVCAFFHSRDEEYRVLLPFIREGIERGERVFHIVDPVQRRAYLRTLEETGLPVAELESSGQLDVRGWDQVYVRGGHFDQNAVLQLMEEMLGGSKEQGYPRTRVMGGVEWTLEDRPGVDDIVEYETRLNYVVPKYDSPVVCTYEYAKYGAGVVMDILRTHPMVIIGGLLQVNPFFVPPDEFLRELRGRASPPSSA